MKIQYIKIVRSPRAARGNMHDLRDVPEHIGRPLVDGGYAVFIPDPGPQPEPKPATTVQPEPKSAKKTKTRTKAKTRKKTRSKP